MDKVEAFLRSRKTENTRRSYRQAIDGLCKSAGKEDLGKIDRGDVARWVDEMKAAKMADTTVMVRVAAISAYYIWGMEMELEGHNPAAISSLRPKVMVYGKSKYLTGEQVKAILAKVPRETVEGKRDLALISLWALTGRRNSEIRLLRWGDVSREEGIIWYRWSGKGKAERNEMPGSAWELVNAYLRAAGRLAGMKDEDYIFLREDGTPVTAELMNRHLKKYARKAGIAWWRDVHVHTLRHSSAMGRLQLGAGVEEISADLAHSNLAITGIYVRKVAGRRDVRWMGLSELFGVPAVEEERRRRRSVG